MPLIKSASKKAFGENVKREMDSGMPQKQSLAVAYNIKRKAPKKYAKGGAVSAKDEKRPMPDELDNDAVSAHRNSGDKALKDSQWTGRPTVAQAQSPSPHALSTPSDKGSDPAAQRQRKMRGQEADMIDIIPPSSDKDQPQADDDEEGANRQGPRVSDMASQHNNGRAPYAHGGMANHVAHQMGEESPGMSDPSSDMLESHNYGAEPGMADETSPHTGETQEDMMRRHAMEMASFAHGGPTGPMNPKLQQSHLMPEEEGSMAREIMHKRKMAEGGKVRRDDMTGAGDSMFDFPHDGGQVDLEGNSEEDLNNEDQMSYRAGLKEQYNLRQLSKQPKDSNTKGDQREADEENDHDESDVKQIRKKMKKKAD